MAAFAAASGAAGSRPAPGVPRGDGERQSQRIARVSIGNRLQIRDLDRHRRMGRDVGHRRGEHVGALLVHDAGPLALAAGLRIVRLRLRLFLNVPADGALADVHEQFIDRCIRGERKHVQALHPIAAGVRELLYDVHPRDVAGDLRLHGRCDPQRLHRFGVRRGFQIQGAGLHLGQVLRVCGRNGREPREQPGGNRRDEGGSERMERVDHRQLPGMRWEH